MTAKQFVNKHHIRATVEWADSNPNMDSRDMNHYKVTLRMGRRQMTTPFSQGFGITGEPTADDVLDCMASDATTVDNGDSFEDFCGELGYDTDSRQAERIYKATQAQTAKLKRFLGDELYNVLLWDTERS